MEFKQGERELELNYCGEYDLHEHVECDKNPGHRDFIPIKSLTKDKIANFCVDETREIEEFCKHAAIRTVKIKVQRISARRSKIHNDPLSKLAGQKALSLGSGCVTDIDASGDKGSFLCPLSNCSHSGPHQVYGYIIVTTAAHVVLDNSEAKEALLEFFDDDPKDKKSAITAHGLKVRNVSLDGDNCELICITHSKPLFEKFVQMFATLPNHPDIFQFADRGNKIPSFISLLGALADIRDCNSQGRINYLCDLQALVRHELEKIFIYDNINSMRPDSMEVKNFLLKAEQVTRQQGLMNKVLASLSSREMVCDFMEISFHVIIEKVTILGAFQLVSKVHERHLNIFVKYFFSRIVDCLNYVTRLTYGDTSNYIDNTIVVHISHPHGLSKQVSLGKYFSSNTTDGHRKHIYTVPTCNGCSGGPVWILPGGFNRRVRWEQVYGVQHGGCFDKKNMLNHSCSQTFCVLQLQKFFNRLDIQPYGNLLNNISLYKNLLNIGPYRDLPDFRHDLHVLMYLFRSNPHWKDHGFNINQQNLFYELNQSLPRHQSDMQSVVPQSTLSLVSHSRTVSESQSLFNMSASPIYGSRSDLRRSLAELDWSTLSSHSGIQCVCYQQWPHRRPLSDPHRLIYPSRKTPGRRSDHLCVCNLHNPPRRPRSDPHCRWNRPRSIRLTRADNQKNLSTLHQPTFSLPLDLLCPFVGPASSPYTLQTDPQSPIEPAYGHRSDSHSPSSEPHQSDSQSSPEPNQSELQIHVFETAQSPHRHRSDSRGTSSESESHQSDSHSTSPEPDQSELQSHFFETAQSPHGFQSDSQGPSSEPHQSDSYSNSPEPAHSKPQSSFPEPARSEPQSSSPAELVQSEPQSSFPEPHRSDSQSTSSEPHQSDSQSSSPEPVQSEPHFFETAQSPHEHQRNQQSPSPELIIWV